MKKNLTLLYIEDEPLIRQQAVEYLSRLYETGREAPDERSYKGIFWRIFLGLAIGLR